MPKLSPRRSSPALVAAAAAVVLLSTPGVAAAEGPGYDGRADQLVLAWDRRPGGGAQERPAGLVVSGAGFRGGSPVSLRVGASAEQTAVADATGTVRVVVGADPHPGTTIVAVGQTPSGSTWTLLGSVPSTERSARPWSLGSVTVTVTVTALGVLALAGALVRRVGDRRRGRPAFYRPRHGSNR